MKIVAVSDLHGNLPELPSCELVCIAGDISPLYIQRNNDEMRKWLNTEFRDWTESLDCNLVILVAGNHDFALLSDKTINTIRTNLNKVLYLEDDFIEYKDKVIYGSPWVAGPVGWAFYDPSFNRVKTTMTENIDLAIFHQPLKFGGNGKVHQNIGRDLPDFGSQTLEDTVREFKPKNVITGHVHSGSHELLDMDGTKLINVSMLDERYDMVYEPTVINI